MLKRNNKYRIIPLITLILFFNTPVFSDVPTKTDSLLNKFKLAPPDKQAEILNELTIQPLNTPEQAMEYAGKALQSAEKFNNHIEQAKALNNMGNICTDLSNYEKAINYHRKSLNIKQQLHDEKGIGISYNNIGNVYLMWGKYNDALEYYEKSLDIFQESELKKETATALNNIGNIYNTWSNYEKAIELYQQSLKIREQIGNEADIAKSFVSIANVYIQWKKFDKALEYYRKSLVIFEKLGAKQTVALLLNNIGNVYAAQEKNQEAIRYYEKSLFIVEKLNDERGIASSLNNIGIIYDRWKDYEKSLDYHQRALTIREKIGDKQGVASSLNFIGKVYFDLKQYDKSVEHLQKGLQIATSLNLNTRRKDIYLALYDTYAAMGNYKEAFNYTKLYIELNDSIFNQETHKQIEELQTKYETEKKQQALELLTKKNQIQKFLVVGLTILISLVIIIALLFLRQNKLRSKQKSVELEQKLLRSQMTPHFIFNSLTAIQNFIFKKDATEADKLLSSFAKLMRLILDNSRKEYVPLDKEVQTLEHYLKLQKIRFENKFDYAINIDPEIEIETTLIPPMLAQPFIENSIEHGIFYKETKGQIDIRFILKENLILFEVEDNGIGRAKAADLNKNKTKTHESLATTITKERLSTLNKKNRQKIKLDIIDLKDSEGNAQGTKVAIYIPFT